MSPRRARSSSNLQTKHSGADMCGAWIACSDSTADDRCSGFAGCETLTAAGGRNVGAARAAGVRHRLPECRQCRPSGCGSRAPTPTAWCLADWVARMVRLADRGSRRRPRHRRARRGPEATTCRRTGADGTACAAWARPCARRGELGIRASAYLFLGGWPPLSIGEDVALAARAAMAGHLRVVRTAGIRCSPASPASKQRPSGRWVRRLPPRPPPDAHHRMIRYPGGRR